MVILKTGAINKEILDSILVLSRLIFFSNVESTQFLTLQKNCHNYLDRGMLEACYLLDEHCQIIGACLLLKRRVRISKVETSAVFISHVMIHPQFQGLGYFYKLLNTAHNYLISEGIWLAIVVARKSADGLYPRVGYSGFGTFSEFRVNLNGKFTQLKDSELTPLPPRRRPAQTRACRGSFTITGSNL